MKLFKIIAAILVTLSVSAFAVEDDEVALFSAQGKATAYIAEDLTIYTWTGKPSVYLEKNDGGKGFHVYGFNGKHLGWFVGGIIYDHDGEAVGAVKDAFAGGVELEPFKAFKQFKPFKAFKEFAPFQPVLKKNWSDTPFRLYLMQGTDQ